MKFGFSFLVVMIWLVTGVEANAAGGRDYEVDYFKERGLKTQVGTFYKPCGTGAAKLTGHRTRFFTKSQSTCPNGGHAPPSSTVSCHFTEAGCTDALVRGILTARHK